MKLYDGTTRIERFSTIIDCDPVLYENEPLEETCDRALKEVGAIRIKSNEGIEWYWPDLLGPRAKRKE